MTKAKAKGEYIGVLEEGDAMGLSDMRIGKTICAAVKFTGDGRIVKRGTRYWKGEEPRNIKATAARMAKPWQSYLARTGERWELKQDKVKATKKAARDKARELDTRKRANAPKLAELLATIVGHWDFQTLLKNELTGTKLVDAAREARELLDFIKTGKEAGK